jgi:hypothetical protein
VSLRVTAAGRPVSGVTIRFAGRSKRTGARGRRTFCARLKPGRYRASATRSGYRAAKRSVRVRT